MIALPELPVSDESSSSTTSGCSSGDFTSGSSVSNPSTGPSDLSLVGRTNLTSINGLFGPGEKVTSTSALESCCLPSSSQSFGANGGISNSDGPIGCLAAPSTTPSVTVGDNLSGHVASTGGYNIGVNSSSLSDEDRDLLARLWSQLEPQTVVSFTPPPKPPLPWFLDKACSGSDSEQASPLSPDQQHLSIHPSSSCCQDFSDSGLYLNDPVTPTILRPRSDSSPLYHGQQLRTSSGPSLEPDSARLLSMQNCSAACSPLPIGRPPDQASEAAVIIVPSTSTLPASPNEIQLTLYLEAMANAVRGSWPSAAQSVLLSDKQRSLATLETKQSGHDNLFESQDTG
ncbi:unnamed protein product [Protopolystoma xenopodis]|uniref:Uncharacterized protein n=1 Tax=Protopolystoma xenopodis TaxID=117903 RepID=A0A448XGI4_9PLAT|nr:unnamed protein product [Protopolystoma xenopodis]